MVDLHIGRHGVIILLVVFLLLAAEDILIWINAGVIPAVEFWFAMAIVLVIVALAIHEANLHPRKWR